MRCAVKAIKLVLGLCAAIIILAVALPFLAVELILKIRNNYGRY